MRTATQTLYGSVKHRVMAIELVYAMYGKLNDAEMTEYLALVGKCRELYALLQGDNGGTGQ